MEEAQGTYIQEDEIIGMNVQLGMEGTNSNGLGGGKEEEINLVETLRKLQTDVQIHKTDKERLMKAKE